MPSLAFALQDISRQRPLRADGGSVGQHLDGPAGRDRHFDRVDILRGEKVAPIDEALDGRTRFPSRGEKFRKREREGKDEGQWK